MTSDNSQVFIDRLAQKTHSAAVEKGCSIPYAVVREIVENLIHANFMEVVISISADGHYIRISDHGPGICDVEKAFQPGYSTATREMKTVIKGVGSGLAIVRDFLRVCGGQVTVENNLAKGTVVTLYDKPDGDSVPELTASRTEVAATSELKSTITSSRSDQSPAQPISNSSHVKSNQAQIAPGTVPETQKETSIVGEAGSGTADFPDAPTEVNSDKLTHSPVRNELADDYPSISERQRNVLSLVGRWGQLGPSDAASELSISLSTAFRDLVGLEEKGLVSSDNTGKRRLTDSGARLLEADRQE